MQVENQGDGNIKKTDISHGSTRCDRQQQTNLQTGNQKAFTLTRTHTYTATRNKITFNVIYGFKPVQCHDNLQGNNKRREQ